MARVSDEGGTVVLSHDDCILHDVGPHPECPARVKRIMGALKRAFPELPVTAAPLATREQLLLFHSPAHVDKVLGLCEKVERNVTSGATTKGGRKKKARGAVLEIDEDTAVMAKTQAAALRAVGACCRAVDLVVAMHRRDGGSVGGAPLAAGAPAASRDYNAFCVVRPPGHHAEPEGAMGFCLFNSVGIAAVHAQRAHGVGRVAVVDFDVHHGNGTQAFFGARPSLFYASTHQYDPKAGFYPGTGAAAETGAARNVLNVPLMAGAGSAAFRAAFEERVLPALEAFAPELLLLSTGFDAHDDDPLAGCCFQDGDYAWATAQLTALLVSSEPRYAYTSIQDCARQGGQKLCAKKDTAYIEWLRERYADADLDTV